MSDRDFAIAPDYISLWNGRDSLTDGAGWVQLRNGLLEAAPGNRDWPTTAECEKAVKAPSWRQECDPSKRKPGRPPQPARKVCLQCHAPLSGYEVRLHIARCQPCRKVRALAAASTHCACGRALFPSEQAKGMRRCKGCRRTPAQKAAA